ncbi:amino acid ABC transporter ATP-binding protein (partial), partial [Pectobacterium atrosepticum SCRI1043]
LVVVTHEIGFDRVVFVVEGKIVESGESWQVLNHPRHPRTINFLNKVL